MKLPSRISTSNAYLAIAVHITGIKCTVNHCIFQPDVLGRQQCLELGPIQGARPVPVCGLKSISKLAKGSEPRALQLGAKLFGNLRLSG